ncbi:MAG: class I poly(R)-hydroxyalkanoic acid synthase [Actinomycetota bacterium]|nr:class I poly(R)-hydroxyalkanoic acid synthase [Actinomycetota bacterium]
MAEVDEADFRVDEHLGASDPAAFTAALSELSNRVASDPDRALRASMAFSQALSTAVVTSVSRALGLETEADAETKDEPPSRPDKRFTDPAWEENPYFFAQREMYLAWSRFMRDLVDDVELEAPNSEKAKFAVNRLVDAMAPTNFLWTNPAALRRAIETQGQSVLQGLDNFMADQSERGGMPRQVDDSEFEVGKNLACTPGKVVFRNDLMELIQYAPQTETVFEVPLLISPPWINRYYIMDLAPGRSLMEWAVQHGHTTFAISYRNPDESMRDVALDDYLIHGLGQAVNVVREITGSDQVNLAGLCVGGTLAVALMAYLAHNEESPVRSATLLNTLVDFSEPGPLGAFIDAESVDRLEERMAERGLMPGEEMANTFNALRPNDLVWNYVSANWLMGESPPAFDILAWNADSTNIPAATHSAYLRKCYLENSLAKSELELAGRRLVLDRIQTDTYVVAAKEDHITPWNSSYRTTGLLSGPVKFVLTSSGHIAGVVNPPSPKRHYWTNDDLPARCPDDPDTWLESAARHEGSWWGDWTEWIAERAGEQRTPPAIGNDTYRALADAPGTYIRS